MFFGTPYTTTTATSGTSIPYRTLLLQDNYYCKHDAVKLTIPKAIVATRYLKQDTPLNIDRTLALFDSVKEAWYMSTRSGWSIHADFRKENTLQAMAFVWTNMMVFGMLFASSVLSFDAMQPRSF